MFAPGWVLVRSKTRPSGILLAGVAGRTTLMLGKLKRLAGIVAVVALVMTLTAFSGRLISNELMTGYALMIHVGTAPVFLLARFSVDHLRINAG